MGDTSTTTPARPAGFPACRTCPYLRRNDPAVCLACCTGRLPALQAQRCSVCDQPVAPGHSCANDWCTRADRWFSTARAIGPHSGVWRRAIAAYKYRADTAWADVFGRILVGYLDGQVQSLGCFDLVVPTPAYRGPGARRDWDHVGAFVSVAAGLAGARWHFAAGLVTKVAETEPLTGKSRPARRACAEGPLRRALRVPDQSAIAGRRVLVVDDVFTEGSTLREVARALILAGSVEVAGIALARQPWQPIRTAGGVRPPPT